MGLSTTFQCLTVIPLLLFSDRIFRKLSHPNVQVLCFAVNVVRLIGMYTSFPHYQRIFLFLIILNFPFKQDIRICTIHICVCYLNRWMRFPGTLRARRMQPMLTNQERRLLQLPFKDYWEDLPSDQARIFLNIKVTYKDRVVCVKSIRLSYAGFGVGSSGGSLLIGAYGQRVTFRILGGISFITGLFYFLFNFFYLRLKNTKTMDNADTVNQNEMASERISTLSSNGGSS